MCIILLLDSAVVRAEATIKTLAARDGATSHAEPLQALPPSLPAASQSLISRAQRRHSCRSPPHSSTAQPTPARLSDEQGPHSIHGRCRLFFFPLSGYCCHLSKRRKDQGMFQGFSVSPDQDDFVHYCRVGARWQTRQQRSHPRSSETSALCSWGLRKPTL